MSKLIKLSIDVTAIPKESIKPHTNGKKYISVDCWVNDSVDRFGKDVSLNMSQSKEERDAKTPKTYIGGGETKFGFGTAAPFEDKSNAADDMDSEIPF